jgi:hypothetical protein
MGKLISVAATMAIVAIVAVSACKKEERCSIHPEPFIFSIIDGVSKADLLASNVYKVEEIGIYYFYENERHDLIVNLEPSPVGPFTELKVIQLPMISLTGRSDEFYLQLNSGNTDTLLVIVERLATEECDLHPYTTVKHNGKDIAAGDGGVFLIEK